MADRSDNSTPVLALETYDSSDLLALGSTTASQPSNPPPSQKFLVFRQDFHTITVITTAVESVVTACTTFTYNSSTYSLRQDIGSTAQDHQHGSANACVLVGEGERTNQDDCWYRQVVSNIRDVE